MSSLFSCLKCLFQNFLFSSNHYTWSIFPRKSFHIQPLLSTAISSIPASFPLCTVDENSGLSASPNRCKGFLTNLPAASFPSSKSSPRMPLESLSANLIASLHFLKSSNIPISYRFKPNDIIMAQWGTFIFSFLPTFPNSSSSFPNMPFDKWFPKLAMLYHDSKPVCTSLATSILQASFTSYF